MRFLAVLLLATAAFSADFQQAKILDVQLGSVANDSALHRWAASDGGSIFIPNAIRVIGVEVVVDGIDIAAQFREQKHFRASMLTIGESVDVRISGDYLILKDSKGKEVKGKILRKAKV